MTESRTTLGVADAIDGHLLLGSGTALAQLRSDIESAARSESKVLIGGETGVGKEVVARMIHARSARRRHSFLAVNCAGLPDDLLESELFGHVRGSFTGAYRDKAGLASMADRGTLFLDELGEMSPRMQGVLLRFLETGEIHPVGSDRMQLRADVRVITATNRDLLARIAAGRFREDLYYRLNVIRSRFHAAIAGRTSWRSSATTSLGACRVQGADVPTPRPAPKGCCSVRWPEQRARTQEHRRAHGAARDPGCCAARASAGGDARSEIVGCSVRSLLPSPVERRRAVRTQTGHTSDGSPPTRRGTR